MTNSPVDLLQPDFDSKIPAVLLPYQQEWIADKSPLKIGEKSRRIGLTWAEAADAALTCSLQKSAGGCHHFYVGSNKEMAREFIDAVAMWAKAFNKAAGEIQEEVFEDEDKSILTFVVYFSSGFKVQALSSNPSNLRGMQGNVTIDEAAFHERLAEVLKAATALTMWGAKIRVISTHNGVDNLFNQLINDSRAKKKEYSVHTITLDDACRQGLYRRICQIKGSNWTQQAEDEWKAGLLKATATEEDALEEYFCVPKQGGGVYIKRTLVDRAMEADIPIVRFTAPKDFELQSDEQRKAYIDDWCADNLKPWLEQCDTACRHVLGEDFARKGDLSVFVPLAIASNLRKRVPFVVELANAPYETQRQILFYLLLGLPRLRAASYNSFSAPVRRSTSLLSSSLAWMAKARSSIVASGSKRTTSSGRAAPIAGMRIASGKCFEYRDRFLRSQVISGRGLACSASCALRSAT